LTMFAFPSSRSTKRRSDTREGVSTLPPTPSAWPERTPPRARSAWQEARLRTRSLMPRTVYSSASRSRTSRRFASRSPPWPPRSRPPASSCTMSARKSTQGEQRGCTPRWSNILRRRWPSVSRARLCRFMAGRVTRRFMRSNAIGETHASRKSLKAPPRYSSGSSPIPSSGNPRSGVPTDGGARFVAARLCPTAASTRMRKKTAAGLGDQARIKPKKYHSVS
jgi:hypothetical protein